MSFGGAATSAGTCLATLALRPTRIRWYQCLLATMAVAAAASLAYVEAIPALYSVVLLVYYHLMLFRASFSLWVPKRICSFVDLANLFSLFSDAFISA